MEQNRSYRSEASSDNSDTSTSSSSKKSATPRYQGAAYQPVVQPRSYDASYGGNRNPLPHAPPEGWIPLRNRIVQEQIDKQEDEKKDSSSGASPSALPNKPVTSAPHPRSPEGPSAAQLEQQQHMHDMYVAEGHKSKEAAESDSEDDDSEHESATAAAQVTDKQQEHAPLPPAEQEDHPAQAAHTQERPQPLAAPVHDQPRTMPSPPLRQEQAFTPPEEGIPTLSIPEDRSAAPALQAEETPLQHQWQSEAAPAFTHMAEYAADAPVAGTSYNQPPLPPVKPPTESAAFAQPPEYPGSNPNAYNPYNHPGLNPAEYQPTSVSQTTEYAPTVERRDSWKMPTLLMLGAVLYEGHRRRVGDRREAGYRAAADEALEKRFGALMSRRHEDVLRTQAATTEHIRELQSEQHQQVHEQQRIREVQERFGAQPLTYGSERVQSVPTYGAERPAPEQQRHIAEAAPNKPVAELTAEEAMRQAQEQQERTRKVQTNWYETEVNAVTGQEVEGVVHGKGYHEERQQEIMRDRTGDATTDPVAASMGSYAVQAQGMPLYGTATPSLPSGMTNPALPQGVPTHVDAQHQLQAGGNNTVRSNVTNPWFWLMLGLILAAFFTAALI